MKPFIIFLFFISHPLFAGPPTAKSVKLKGFYHRICDPKKIFAPHSPLGRNLAALMKKQSPRWKEFMSDRTINLDPNKLSAKRKKRVLDIWKSGSFTRSSYYRRVSEKIKPNYAEYIQLRYGNHNNIATKLKGLGEQFLALASDPGLITYISEFEKFVKKNYKKSSDRANPWAIRRAFSDEMGHVHFFRGMALDNNAFESISKMGIQASAYRLRKSDRGRLVNLNAFTQNIQKQFEDRVMNNRDPENDPLISVSKYYFIAYEVAKEYAGEGKNVYVYRMRVPRMQVLMPKKKKESVLHSIDPLPGAIESFIPVVITPQEIIRIDNVKEIVYPKKYSYGELAMAFFGIAEDAAKKNPSLCGL